MPSEPEIDPPKQRVFFQNIEDKEAALMEAEAKVEERRSVVLSALALIVAMSLVMATVFGYPLGLCGTNRT